MIFDSHMHVGDFGPMMNVGVDTEGIALLMREHDIDGGILFAPDAALVAALHRRDPGPARPRLGQPEAARLRRGHRSACSTRRASAASSCTRRSTGSTRTIRRSTR